jgi:hypothetical protein
MTSDPVIDHHILRTAETPMPRRFLKPHKLRLKSKISISPALPRTPIAGSVCAFV